MVCNQILDSETGTYTQKGWVEASIINEKDYFSAYNWNKFGFNIIEDGIEEYMYVVQDYFRIPTNYEPKENDSIYDDIKTTSQGFESLSTTR